MKYNLSRIVFVWSIAAVFMALPFASLRADVFSYADFSSTAGLNLVRDAAQVGTDLRLNPATERSRGAAWYDAKQLVRDGFQTTFSFRITDTGGAGDFHGISGGDGFAFVIQNAEATAFGNDTYMGYEIVNSLAVEFDTWRNPNITTLDPSGNHVGVQSKGVLENTPFADAFLGAANVGPNMSDGGLHQATVLYTPGTLKIFVDDMNTEVLSVSVNLDDTLNLDDGRAYVGFTGGGVTAYENHDISSWEFASVPEPSTFALYGACGLVLACGRLWRRKRSRP